MAHNIEIVILLTIGFALASLFGYITYRLHLPSILGYLLAGFFMGPYSPGFVGNTVVSEQLAEIGVILMLFGVGLHFNLKDLINVKNIAIPGATVQTLTATLVSIVILYAAGWSIESGIIIGLSAGVASTVVLVRVLSENHLLHTKEGHIAVGWLIVEDIFTVIILILLPTLAAFSQGKELSFVNILSSIVFVITKFMVLALFMFTIGHKIVSFILTNIARSRSQELFTLTVLALIFLIATGSAVVFGTSMALGAFIAGMVIGKTTVRHQAAANALPLKDVFAIIFFLSVGMLFNPTAVMNHFFLFLSIMGVILIVKPLSAFLITIFFNYSIRVALTVAIALAQIGEFSFILAEEAMNLNLLPDDGFDILVACALVSISINPLIFKMINQFESVCYRVRNAKNGRKELIKKEIIHEKNNSKVILIGYGPIGKEVAKIIKKFGFDPVIIEHNIDTVENLEEGTEIIFGDAIESHILENAYIKEAKYLIITMPETEKTFRIIDAARRLNPNLPILARVKFITEKKEMEELKVQSISSEEEALKEFSYLLPELLKKV